MKMPEPVAWMDSSDLELMHKHGRGCIAWGNKQNNAKTPLYSEAQMREALASHEAVMRMALRALRHGKPMFDAYWGGTEFDEAIKALEESLGTHP